MAHGPLPDLEVKYCYACFQWHDKGEHRRLVKLPFRLLLWVIKIWWHGVGGIGMFCGFVVLALMTYFFLMMAYAMIASSLGLPIPENPFAWLTNW
jgi:hypothetical protein